jgi:hypothetical protein
VLIVRDVVVKEVLDVPVLLLEVEVDVLVMVVVVVKEVLDVPVLLLEVEVDVLVVREVLDVLVLLLEVEVDVLVVLVVVVKEVLDVLVVDVCTRSKKTVCKGHTHCSCLSKGVCRMIFEGSKSFGPEFNEEQ